MAIGYANLFTRLGKSFYLLKQINTWRGAGGTYDTEFEDVLDEYDGVDLDLQQHRANFTKSRESGKRGLDSVAAAIQTLCQQDLIFMVNDDNPQPDNTLRTALIELARQMDDDSESIESQSPSLNTTYDTSSGSTNDTGLISTLIDGYNQTREYVYAEDIVFTFDSENSWTAKGEQAAPSMLHEKYPDGSGANDSGTAATVGLVTNGDWETWTNATTPGTWTVVTGTWNQETTTVFRGDNAAKISGDGATLHEVTSNVLSISGARVYAYHLRIRLSSVPAAGTLTVGLHYLNGNGWVVDQAGTPAEQKVAIDLTAEASGSWIVKSGIFRTEEPLFDGEDGVALRLVLGPALSNTVDLFIDQVGLVEMTELYAGGPLVALFEDEEPWSVDDRITLSVTNAWGSEMAQYCSAVFDLRGNGVKLPSDGTPTRADSLIA